jgi:hypothetical protein
VPVPEECQDSKEEAQLPLSLELSPTLDEGDQAPADDVPKKIFTKLDKLLTANKISVP